MYTGRLKDVDLHIDRAATLIIKMPAIRKLVVRDDTSSSSTMTPTMMNLLIALVVLVIVAISLIAALLVLRSHRKSRNQKYPTQHPLHPANNPKASKHRRLTVTATPYSRRSDLYVYNEKQTLIDAAASPPQSPVPEIRITFPEEEDAVGKRQSGRVVVVRISEQGGLGLEPYNEEQLPPYQSSESGRFESLDLDRIGGLKEVERKARIS